MAGQSVIFTLMTPIRLNFQMHFGNLISTPSSYPFHTLSCRLCPNGGVCSNDAQFRPRWVPNPRHYVSFPQEGSAGSSETPGMPQWRRSTCGFLNQPLRVRPEGGRTEVSTYFEVEWSNWGQRTFDSDGPGPINHQKSTYFGTRVQVLSAK